MLSLGKTKACCGDFFFALRTPAELAAVLCMYMEGCARGGCFFMCISPPVHCPWPWAQPRRLRSRPCFGLHQDIVLLQRASNWLMVPWPLLRNADHPISASNRHTRKPVTFDESGDGMASTTSRGREEEEGKKEGVVRGGGGKNRCKRGTTAVVTVNKKKVQEATRRRETEKVARH